MGYIMTEQCVTQNKGLYFGLFSHWFYFRAKCNCVKLRIKQNLISSTWLELQWVTDMRWVNFNNGWQVYFVCVWEGGGSY